MFAPEVKPANLIGDASRDIRSRRTKRSKRVHKMDVAKLTSMLELEAAALKTFAGLSEMEQAAYQAAHPKSFVVVAEATPHHDRWSYNYTKDLDHPSKKVRSAAQDVADHEASIDSSNYYSPKAGPAKWKSMRSAIKEHHSLVGNYKTAKRKHLEKNGSSKPSLPARKG